MIFTSYFLPSSVNLSMSTVNPNRLVMNIQAVLFDSVFRYSSNLSKSIQKLSKEMSINFGLNPSRRNGLIDVVHVVEGNTIVFFFGV